MREFQPTAKSLEKTKKAEEKAKGTLQDFLNSSYKAIRAMCVYNKIIDAQGVSYDELEGLESIIEKESKGKLAWFSAVLCEIGETGEEFAEGHEGVLFGKELSENAKAIKGCFFMLN